MTLAAMDEHDFRTLADEEGIGLTADNPTVQAMLVKAKLDERAKRERGKFWLKMAPLILGALAGTGYGVNRVVPEGATTEQVETNTKSSTRNSIQINKLGLEAINTQEQIVEGVNFQEKNTAAIMEAIETGKATNVEKPQVLKDLEKAVEVRAKKAAAGNLLEVSDEELAAALAEDSAK